VATLDDELIGVANLAITGEASIGELGLRSGEGIVGTWLRHRSSPSTHRLRVRRAETTPDNGDVSSDNFASARVLEKAGMHFEKTPRDHLRVRGGWRVFAVAASDEGAVHAD